MNDHIRHFPRCPFILGLPVGNIAITSATEAHGVVEPNREPEGLGKHKILVVPSFFFNLTFSVNKTLPS